MLKKGNERERDLTIPFYGGKKHKEIMKTLSIIDVRVGQKIKTRRRNGKEMKVLSNYTTPMP